MTLMEAFSEHLVAGQQGQLVIKFAGDVHLCKILVEDGRAVHIAHGRTSPEEILATLNGKTVEWVNFIAGYPVRKKLDFPLHENLLSAAEQQSPQVPQTTEKELPAEQPPEAPPAPSGPHIEAEKVIDLVEGFIELIGPLGTILAEKASMSLGYVSGTPIPEESFNRLLQALAKDVPDDDRDAFIDQFKL